MKKDSLKELLEVLKVASKSISKAKKRKDFQPADIVEVSKTALRSLVSYLESWDLAAEDAVIAATAISPLIRTCEKACLDLDRKGEMSQVRSLSSAFSPIEVSQSAAVPRKFKVAVSEFLSLAEETFKPNDKKNSLDSPVRVYRFHGELSDQSVIFSFTNVLFFLRHLPMGYAVTDIHSPQIAQNSIDIMTSRAVLEHFLDFATAVRRLFDIMAPGGIAFHSIDLVDHRAYESKDFHYWSFLSEGESWSDGVCNRLRSQEIRPLLEEAGFDILSYEEKSSDMPEGFINQISPHLLSKMSIEELNVICVECVLRRPFR